jgi:hypothetical protein
MTLTILRKNKNTTTTNLLTPLSDLRLAQKTRRNEAWSGSHVRKAVQEDENHSIPRLGLVGACSAHRRFSE